MKKRLCMGLVIMVLLGSGVSAAEEEARRMLILSGTVTAGETVTVTAPFGGTVEDFTLRKGDFVGAGDALFTIQTVKLYAPCDGVVGSLRAQAGDEASFLTDRYGALLFVEPKSRFLVKTDTKYAYAADENLDIHVGETVYVGSRNNNARVGTGYVTAVDGKAYTVEIISGNLVMEDPVSVFRARDFAAETKIGSGTISMNPNVPITGDGTVFRVHVTQGQEVKRGELLLEMVGGASAYNPYPTNRVTSGYAAIVASVDVTAGASVSKAQVMATLYPLESLQAAVELPEADLKNLAVGDKVRVELMGFYDQESFEGTVASISGLSSAESGAEEAQYTAYVAFEATNLVRVGMNVTVYANE